MLYQYVKSIDVSRSLFYEGYGTRVYVTVENRGSSSQTFDLSVSFNSSYALQREVVANLLGWRSHTVASMKAYPITYVVRAANVNDKEVVKPLLKQASRLLKRYKKRISHVIADSQYYSAEVFKTIRGYVAEPVIPHPINVKEPLINLHDQTLQD